MRNYARAGSEPRARRPERNEWLDELGLAMRDLEPPRPRAGFRSTLRHQLVATASARPQTDELSVAAGAIQRPQASPAFRAALRRRLLATAAAQPPRKPAVGPFVFLAPRFAPRYVLAALLAIAVVAGAGGGAAAASSLPGERAYVLKQLFERVELAVALDPVTRTVVLARQADRRLNELARATVSRSELRPTATLAYEAAVSDLRAAVDALVAADDGERADLALEVAEAAAAMHVAVIEGLAGAVREPRERDLVRAELMEALQRARELREAAKQHKHDREDQKEKDPGRPDWVVPGRPEDRPTPNETRPRRAQ